MKDLENKMILEDTPIEHREADYDEVRQSEIDDSGPDSNLVGGGPEAITNHELRNKTLALYDDSGIRNSYILGCLCMSCKIAKDHGKPPSNDGAHDSRHEPANARSEPEESFSVSVRLRMMINHISTSCGYDQRQLINLLKDAKRELDEYAQLTDAIIETADKVKETEDRIRSGMYQGSQG